ncbi:hypothetical protein QYH69_14045 [Paraburkholderia sp. SARCC-3016]|uniref:hypothetical protein n=1 Tax=Paraburkholderia sp. SARCC-3016 TaxID=3058611 RepID=UPI002806E727|nr:hypothetical protein [Paraburkholderia sp. SARCC-3016]MDQ7978368.1 hypothetical protein [Paraburkholderia sp. SARCC-3016]
MLKALTGIGFVTVALHVATAGGAQARAAATAVTPAPAPAPARAPAPATATPDAKATVKPVVAPASNSFIAPVGAVMAVPAPGVRDERSFMHGIGQADAGDGKTWVFFSSSGLPPRGANREGNWPHDVYVGQWEPGDSHLTNTRTFIKRPEAQEPVSVAQNTKGTIFITFEDGWNAPRNVSQRYGVYSKDLKPIKPYPKDVESGGHSGHVAAVGDRFVVFYSADWVNGGGVDNLGTGGGVYANVYDGRGRLLRHVNVAAHVREWWPVVAGSPTQALLVWQKYIPGSTIASLQYAVLDPRTGKLTRTEDSVDPFRVQYYVYAAAYVPAVDRFVVLATLDSGRAVAFLVDSKGRRTAELDCLPALVRESSVAVEGSAVFVPTQDGRLMTLGVEDDRITLRGTQRAPFAWGNTGVTGIASGDSVHFVSLSPDGLREAGFSTQKQIAAGPADRCVVRAAQ